MDISSKMMEILKRRKELMREACGCIDGCPTCGEKFELHIEMAKANVPVKYWDLEFSDLDAANAQVKEKLIQYCSKFRGVLDRGIGLYLVGANGVGKTLGASLVLKEALRQKYRCRFTTMNEIMAMSSDGMYDAVARNGYRKEIIEVDFLVIDDITKTYKNKEKASSAYIDVQLDHLFRTRANCNLPVIVTSNHERKEALASVDETLSNSLLSLFAEHLKDITFLGKDRRLANGG